jgi:chromate transporter
MKGLRPTIVGLIAVAAVTLFQASLFTSGPLSLSTVEWPAVIAFVVILGLAIKTKLDTIALVGLGGLIGLLFFWI